MADLSAGGAVWGDGLLTPPKTALRGGLPSVYHAFLEDGETLEDIEGAAVDIPPDAKLYPYTSGPRTYLRFQWYRTEDGARWVSNKQSGKKHTKVAYVGPLQGARAADAIAANADRFRPTKKQQKGLTATV